MLARKFDPTSMAGLSAEARKAVNAAFDAMSTWRTETVNNSEKHVAQVVEKMAAAARALGWPEQIVEATHDQMQSLTKMQIQVMDPHDGHLGGADRIAKPLHYAVEAKVYTWVQPNGNT
jgi:hypothetical protein